MTGKSHWPFGGDPWGHGARGSDRDADMDAAKSRSAEQAAIRQRARNDRLIVGGRAHTKKSGLS
jgi:hypothetical protein